ncbi:GNAT family N-acetyltransferase [Vibrio sp. DW001]|uniref:GNAT family N-acetyltransferase n=1 Tax=Vibrio sp. DW001 TaxID=2912315 RepID=UPI0023B092B6|nr:GNAT family N-acetyltransferase [Vibrio sp. DW001]WED28028.1 GNAT family N-acetyltransferase [Vibrio sp. DW001]
MWKEFKFCRLDERVGELQVRLATKDDAKLISDYFIKNKEYLRPWEPVREKAFFTEAGWEKKLIKLNELHLLELGFYCLIINRISGDMLGTISFSNLTRFPVHSCSVGYSLDEDMQGKGIMSQALNLACGWMFKVQNMHRISASYMPMNLKSAAVLKSKGFEKVGFAKDYLLINGRWEDHNLTALLNKEWREKK